MSQSFRQLVLITSYMTSRKFPFSKSCKQVLPQFLKPLNQFLSSCSLIKINFNQNIEPKCQNTKGAYERKILKIIFLKVRNKNVKFKIVKCCSPLLLFFCQKCLSNFFFLALVDHKKLCLKNIIVHKQNGFGFYKTQIALLLIVI